MHDALIERLRDGLADAADGLEVGDPTVGLPAAHRTARRRRNRNRTLGAVLGVAAIGTVAAVVTALVTTDPDSIRTITPATTVPGEDNEDTSDASTTTDVPGTTIPAEEGADGTSEDGVSGVEDASAPIVGTSRLATARAAAAPAAAVGGESFLLPWADGFVVGSIEQYQPSTRLSDEMFARFPQEIQDLFPGGEPPPSVGEAAAIIDDAGYLLQVMDLLNRNPDIAAVVYSQPEYSLITAEFSSDGERWAPFAIEVPDEVASVSEIVVVGNRLVVAGTPATVPDSEPTIAAVASTTDLEEWTVQSFPTGLPVVLPDIFEVSAEDVQVFATEAGWIAHVDVFADLDPTSLLTEDLDAAQWFGTMHEPDGLRVTVYGEDDEVLAERLVPWSELGVDRATFERLQGDPRGAGRFVATWDGEPAPVAAGEIDEIEPLTTGYLGSLWSGQPAPEIRFSADGVTWVPIPAAPPRQRIVGTIAVDDGTLVITEDGVQEHHLYRVDATGQTWRKIDVDGLPPSLRINWERPAAARRGGTIVDGSPPEVFEWNATVEHDGLRLEAAVDRTSATYRVVDVATGDVVAEETADLREVDQWDPFADLEFDVDGWTTVTEPGSASVVARFPADVLQRARSDAERAIYGSGPGDPPDQWFIATVDGVEWIVGDIDDPADDEEFGGFFETQVAVNGRTVLVGAPAGWSVYEL